MKIIVSICVTTLVAFGLVFYDPETAKSDTWQCGDDVTFTYDGATTTYGTVVSHGLCWMTENLGATEVATSYNDSAAYGDLFQWGRLDDGHQVRTSNTTTTLSSTDNPGNSDFILAPSSPYDWRSPQNNNLWQGVSGTNNPCPSGWRLPTSAEWTSEINSWSQQNYNGAYASPLRLTAAGYRSYSDGSLGSLGTLGYYWSSTVSGPNAYFLHFFSSNANMATNYRANGFSVRCVTSNMGTAGIQVSATVQQYLSFTTSATNVTLSPDMVDSSGSPHIASSSNVTLTVNTSNPAGFSITVNGAGNGLASSTNYIYTSPATATIAAGTNGYGIQASSTSANLSVDSNFNWPFTGTTVGSASSSAPITLVTDPSSGINQTLLLRFLAAATASMPAGTYQDTVTLTAVPTVP